MTALLSAHSVRCPACTGMGGELDRFNHFVWHECPLCHGRKTIEIMKGDAMTESMKFSLGVRIDRATSAHVYLSVFSAMIPAEQEHAQATRGKAGELVLRVNELGPFLERVQPDMLLSLDGVDIEALERSSLVGLRVRGTGGRLA